MDAFYASRRAARRSGRCAASRSRSAAARSAAWSRRRATRRAATASARRWPRSPPGGAAPTSSSSSRASTSIARSRNQIRAIFPDYTPLVEPLSLDEAYLDVTEDLKGIGIATRIAEEIRARIREETGLTASAGVSYNKFLAKLASDQNKPDGLCVITPGKGAAFVAACRSGASTASAPRRRRRWRGSASSPAPTSRRRDLAFLERHFGSSGDLLSRPRPRHLPPAGEAGPRAQVDRRRGHLLRRISPIRRAMAAELERISRHDLGRASASGRSPGRTVVLKMKYQRFPDRHPLLFAAAAGARARGVPGDRPARCCSGWCRSRSRCGCSA